MVDGAQFKVCSPLPGCAAPFYVSLRSFKRVLTTKPGQSKSTLTDDARPRFFESYALLEKQVRRARISDYGLRTRCGRRKSLPGSSAQLALLVYNGAKKAKRRERRAEPSKQIDDGMNCNGKP